MKEFSLHTIFRDESLDWLKNHSLGVARLCDLMGEELGLSARDRASLIFAGKIHDLGKEKIPLEVLNKNSRLDAEEWKVMESHAISGFDLATQMGAPRAIANAVLTHHERWDGDGYPFRLKGPEISWMARGIAIADAVDAMTQDRPYRKGKSLAFALLEIERFSGVQFCPDLAATFIRACTGTFGTEKLDNVQNRIST